jgi:hypothetical protein
MAMLLVDMRSSDEWMWCQEVWQSMTRSGGMKGISKDVKICGRMWIVKDVKT